jgi:hypothetical protein
VFKTIPMPDSPDLSDLKALVKNLNQRDGNIKTRRARIDAIVDEDFAILSAVYKKLTR